MILITQSALLDTVAYDYTHTRIGYSTMTRLGTLSASTFAAGHPAYAAGLPNTYESWQATALPAWIMCDAGAAVEADYIGIAAHSLGTSAATFKVQYSADSISWSDAATDLTVPTDAPIMVFFAKQTARYWRIYITGATIPIIGVWYCGVALAMQRPIYGGHTPITLSRRTVIRSNKSEGGQFLGRYIVRSGVSTSAAYQNLTAAWYRQYFDPFVLAARQYPFFFAWRPLSFPNEVAYCWAPGDISPANMGKRDLMSVSFEMEGIGNYE